MPLSVLNQVTLESALRDKFKNIAFHSIVNTAFLNSVAYEATGLEPELKENLSRFSKNMLDKFGGYSVLESAIKHVKSPNQALLLVNIDACCKEFATEAAKEVVKNFNENKDKKYISMQNENIQEIIDNASTPLNVYKKFASNVKAHIDVNKLGKLIKEKTIQAIKDEKDSYEKAKEIDDAITNIVKPQVDKIDDNKEDPSPENEGETEEKDAESGSVSGENTNNDDEKEKENKSKLEQAKESFISLWGIKFTDATDYASLYSKIHEAVTESAFILKSDIVSGVMTDILNDVAMESSSELYGIKEPSLTEKMSLIKRLRRKDEMIQDSEKEITMENAMVTSAVLYSFYETLNSMNLITPALESVTNFITKKRFSNKKIDGYRDTINSSVNTIINDLTKKVSNIRSESALESAFKSYNELVLTTGKTSETDKILSELEKQKAIIMKKPELNYNKYALENATSQFNRLSGFIKSRNDINNVIISGDDYNGNYSVSCHGNNGRPVYESVIHIDEVLTNKTASEYMKICISNSKLKDFNKDIYFKDNLGLRASVIKLN